MTDLPLPRGVRDLMPNEALFRNELLKKIERVFQSFGFLLIDTPSLESLSVLKAKGGIGEEAKLIYEIKDDDIGLRYDNTMSLARYVIMHKELPLPLKRYYIGKVWRREEPQRLRYREFTQADADIVGGEESYSDAEIIALGASVLDILGLEYHVDVNDRSIMDRSLQKLGVGSDQLVNVQRTLDKMDKLEEEEVSKLLLKSGIAENRANDVMNLAGLEGGNSDRFDYIDKLLGDKNATKKLRDTFSLLESYNVKGEIKFSPSVVRGLDYYTGIVFEYKDDSREGKTPTLCGGGRYDALIQMLGGKKMPAVGFALGIDRILEMLDFSSSTGYTYARVLVAYIKPTNYKYALAVANKLRAGNIPTDINMSNRNISNQLSYAASIKVKYAVIVGDTEEKDKTVKVRNMINGNESTISVDDAIKLIEGE